MFLSSERFLERCLISWIMTLWNYNPLNTSIPHSFIFIPFIENRAKYSFVKKKRSPFVFFMCSFSGGQTEQFCSYKIKKYALYTFEMLSQSSFTNNKTCRPTNQMKLKTAHLWVWITSMGKLIQIGIQGEKSYITKGSQIQCHGQRYKLFKEGKKHSLLIWNEYWQKGVTQRLRLENGPVCVVITLPRPLGPYRLSENVVKGFNQQRQTDCSDYRGVSEFTVLNSSPKFKLNEMHSAVWIIKETLYQVNMADRALQQT